MNEFTSRTETGRTGWWALLAAACLIWLAVSPEPVVAQPAQYEAEIPVAGEGAGERSAAFSAAMERILVRLTGAPDIAEHDAAAELIEEASGLVQQFRYESAPPALDEPDGERQRYLVVEFDPRALEPRIRDAELPQWRAETPATLVWLVIESRGDREFLHRETHPELTEALAEAASRLGLRLIFPLLDFEDRDTLRESDVWGRFGREILRASDRYDARSVLAGRLAQDGGEWEGAFAHYLDGDEGTWRNRAGERQAVLEAATTGLARRMQETFRTVPEQGPTENVQVLVERIRGLDDLRHVRGELDRQSTITGVSIDGLTPEVTVLRVAYRGERNGLESALQRAGLEPVPANGTGEQEELRYRLAR